MLSPIQTESVSNIEIIGSSNTVKFKLSIAEPHSLVTLLYTQ